MDQFDATSMMFSKIKNLDPENATKIMGYILIQGFKQRDLVSIACGPDHILHSLIFKAKTQLGLCSNTFSAPTSPSLNPNHSSNPFGRMNGHGSVDLGKNLSLPNPKSSPFLSYENIRAGSSLVPSVNETGSNSGNDMMDEIRLQDYLSFLNESSKNEELMDSRSQLGSDLGDWGQNVNNNGDTHFHRRSFSASDACFLTGGGEEDPSSFGFGGGFKPCLYFARGFCKNGENCKFVHGGFGDNGDVVDGGAGSGIIVGSPSNMDGLYMQHEEIMRIKAIQHQQQQRLAASHFAAAGGSPPLPYDKCMNFLLQQQNDPQRYIGHNTLYKTFIYFIFLFFAWLN